MVSNRVISDKKISFVEKVSDLIDQYHKIIIFEADNVSAAQMQKIRKQLRGRAEIVMGKNTLLRKAFTNQFEKYPNLQKLISQLVYNVGLLFTNESTLGECRSILETPSEAQQPKAGVLAQCDVIIPKGITTISPEKTTFFQSLNISTMINKSAIEIMSDVHLIKAGTKVGESEVTLLNMLNIKPFSYKLRSKIVYDNGDVYSPSVLDITSEDWAEKVKESISTITAISLSIDHFTKCSAPHAILNSYKNIIGVMLELDIENERTKLIKAALESASIVSQTVTSATSVVTEQAPVVEEEESDEELGFSLFD